MIAANLALQISASNGRLFRHVSSIAAMRITYFGSKTLLSGSLDIVLVRKLHRPMVPSNVITSIAWSAPLRQRGCSVRVEAARSQLGFMNVRSLVHSFRTRTVPQGLQRVDFVL